MKDVSLMKPKVFALVVCLQFVAYGQRAADTAWTSARADSSARMGHDGWIAITSNPAGAEVFEDSLYLGITPIDKTMTGEGLHVLKLFYPTVRSWNAQVAIDSVRVHPSGQSNCFVNFGTRSSNGMFKNEIQSHELDQNVFSNSSENNASRHQVGYIAGGTMILSGALSAYLKTNSDNKFSRYVANRDPNLLNKVHELDSWAGASLFITEVSFGVLIYLLLSD